MERCDIHECLSATDAIDLLANRCILKIITFLLMNSGFHSPAGNLVIGDTAEDDNGTNPLSILSSDQILLPGLKW